MSDTPEIQPIPLDAIEAEALTRDRARLDEDALAELQRSVAANGLRLPIEVFPIRDAPGGAGRQMRTRLSWGRGTAPKPRRDRATRRERRRGRS